jgi:hypothetical protein
MSVAPPSLQQLDNVLLLTKEGVQHVWGPDLEAQARVRSEEREQRGEYFDSYYEDLKSARQTGKLPPTYIRRLEQIRRDLYPYMRVQGYNCTDYPENFKSYGIDYDEFYAFRHHLRFYEFRDWLAALPLQRDERVFHALDSPNDTIILEWGLFVDHWDFFIRTGSIFTCNIVDDHPGWFLFFHHDDVAIFGCNLDYAHSKKVSSDVFLPSEQSMEEAFRAQLWAGWKTRRDLELFLGRIRQL